MVRVVWLWMEIQCWSAGVLEKFILDPGYVVIYNTEEREKGGASG
jgi:hypothetical protein